jgi:sugar phosphate isomerase/epimerase
MSWTDTLSIKRRLPFSLGTTSYIIPDDIVPNVEYLAPLVDDIELVLFESPEMSNLPDAETVQRLRELAIASDLTYTVHFPLDIELGSLDGATREASIRSVLRVWETTKTLDPVAYPLHLTAAPDRIDSNSLSAWVARLEESVLVLLGEGLLADQLAVETLNYPFEYVAPLVERHDLSVCLDVGHILLGGYQLEGYLDRWLARCRVVHLHGIERGVDHQHVGGLPEGLLLGLLNRFALEAPRCCVVTVEVFDQMHFQKSLSMLSALSPLVCSPS